MIELYEFALSGNCHKVRLMLSFLELNYTSIAVNGSAREHKSSEFLAMNPLGQLPILKDKDIVIRDSQAILIYLAHHYGGELWWPQDSEALAKISAWLFTVSNEIARGPNA
ncbi:MAG: glutathione S-transferase N-terminal domain-containing protein, partial [Methylotenera sp.]|nr:glutathione S-transferase N-terminal domain-containing protein [Methylotenera sp.]